MMCLTKEQDEKAFKWLNEHILHVMDLVMKSDGKRYPPTLEEDKNNPNLWKANHWMWYVNKKHEERYG